jgi:hypothetical protein
MASSTIIAELQMPSGAWNSIQPVDEAADPSVERPVVRRGIVRTLASWGVAAIVRCWQLFCLVLLLAVAASIPIIQFASLGYLLESAGRWARGQRLRECLPGLALAGRIGTAAFWVAISCIPVFIVRDLAESAVLINPGSDLARRWQIGSSVLWTAWVVYVWWAVLRGGRVYHFLWPAPIRFVRQFFRMATWNAAIDRLATGMKRFRILYLLKFGFLGSVGTLLYLIIPGGLMIAGVRNSHDGNNGAVALFTLTGIIAMAITLQYLPFLQMRYAKTMQFRSFFDIRSVRQGFQRAPWLHAIATVILVFFSLPMYLLRIEMPPSQLVWLLCIFFVLFNLPTKFMLAWAIRYADRRPKKRAWYNRYPAWMLLVSSLPIYVLFLYLASLASWDGSTVMVMQHAFLTPVPFIGR